MSLLNDVLRDLDARRADTTSGADLRREVRSLPVVRESPRLLPWALLALAGLGLAAALWHYFGATPVGAPKPELAKSEPPAAPAPSTISAPVAAAPNSPAAVAPEPSEQPAADAEPALRTALQLDRLPRQETSVARPRAEAPAKPRAEVAAAAAAASRVEAAPLAPVAPPVKPKQDVAEAAAKLPVPESRASGAVEKKPVLATPRDRAEAEMHIAQAALAQGRVNDAIESLRAALRHDPFHSQARQSWLKILLEGRRNDEAIAVLQEGLEGQPNQSPWAMTLARLLLEKNDLAGAERVLARSWPHAAGNAAYAGFYGHLRSRLGQHREAVELYQAATRLAPAEGRWWFGLASAFDSSGRPGEAREAYRQAQNSGNLPAELAAIAEQRLAR